MIFYITLIILVLFGHANTNYYKISTKNNLDYPTKKSNWNKNSILELEEKKEMNIIHPYKKR